MPITQIKKITYKVYLYILTLLNTDKMISTEQALGKVGINTNSIETADLMRIHYEVNKLAKEKGILLDNSYASGLMIGATYTTPYKVKTI